MSLMLYAAMGAATVPPASGPAFDPSAFIFTIRVENDGDSFTWPNRLGGVYDATFDWGDGSSDHVTAAPSAHVYAVAGDYDVAVTGACPAPISDSGWRLMLRDVKQWGALIGATDWDSAFSFCSQLQISATDAFGAGVTIMSFMFTGSSVGAFDASNWDVSSVTTFEWMFESAANANPDVSSWDTGSATNMRDMFNGASAFDRDISGWDVSSVTTVTSMLRDTPLFDYDLSGWCVQHIDASRPPTFAEGSALQSQHYPVWGTCP